MFLCFLPFQGGETSTKTQTHDTGLPDVVQYLGQATRIGSDSVLIEYNMKLW